jgi:putative ABC transport system substrate-binding protein
LIRRREFIGLIGAAAWPFAAVAQTTKVYRVGTLTAGPPISPMAERGAVLFDGLAKHGYMLGHNLVHEARGASGKLELVPRLMQELKAAGVDVVVTISYPAAAAATVSGLPTVLATMRPHVGRP